MLPIFIKGNFFAKIDDLREQKKDKRTKTQVQLFETVEFKLYLQINCVREGLLHYTFIYIGVK